jgi:hypothetical protein
MLLCCGCFTGIFFWGINAVYNQEVVKKAVQKVEANAEVQQAVGTPLSKVYFPPPTGQVTVENQSGDANILFELEGPKGRVKVQLRGRMTDGKWGITSLTATLPDGKRVVFDTAEGDNVATPFTPTSKNSSSTTSTQEKPPEVELNIPGMDESPPEKK